MRILLRFAAREAKCVNGHMSDEQQRILIKFTRPSGNERIDNFFVTPSHGSFTTISLSCLELVSFARFESE
jgi:hypothetical protein